jgi:AraC family transcriptional regulator
MLQTFSGAIVRRTIDRSDSTVPEHAHDWPLLSLFVIGSYANRTDIGDQYISGPSAILYAAGAAHSNVSGPEGFEQIEIEFDPAWLRHPQFPKDNILHWIGGLTGAEARSLARLCSQGLTESGLHEALIRFFNAVRLDHDQMSPEWFDEFNRRLKEASGLRVSDLAREVGLHPSWLGTAYRRAAGEGITHTLARLRVERAARLLRETNQSLALIAIDAGFCDQSHMIRTFRRVLGRLPTDVRRDRVDLRT